MTFAYHQTLISIVFVLNFLTSGFVFVLGMIAMLCSGTMYGFSAWGPGMKNNMKWTQSQLELVGELGNLGGYLGPVNGVMAAMYSERVNCSLAAIACFIGYLFTSLSLSNAYGFSLFRTYPILVGLSYFLVGFGSNLLFSVALQVQIENISKHKRALCCGILLACYGFSASIFASLYNMFGDDNIHHFFIFVAFIVGTVYFMCACFIRQVHHQHTTTTHKNSMIRTVDDDDVDDGDVHNSNTNIATINNNNNNQGNISAEIELVDHNNNNNNNDYRSDMSVDADDGVVDETNINVNSVNADTSSVSPSSSSSSSSSDSDDIHVLRKTTCRHVMVILTYLVKSFDFWMWFFSTLILAGSGMMYFNNVGHVIASLNDGVEDNSFSVFLVFIISLANGAGRLIMATSDFIPIKRGWYLFGSVIIMMIANILNATILSSKSSVYFGSILVGLSYGIGAAGFPIVFSEAYPRSDFTVCYGWLQLAPGLGSVIFNSIAGFLYERHVESGSTECVGSKCFQEVFVFTIVANAIAIFISAKMISPTQIGKKHVDVNSNVRNRSTSSSSSSLANILNDENTESPLVDDSHTHSDLLHHHRDRTFS